MGPSGAGKSTLLHILGLMDKQTSGKDNFGWKVRRAFFGQRLRQDQKRKRYGFLFQMHYLLPDFTVFENILIPVWEEKAKRTKRHKAYVAPWYRPKEGHFPSEISGGEQQRAALARALINNPDLLLCDEPTGDLDRETGQAVEDLIFSECKKQKITMVLVTHNPDLASKAGRIIRMKDGKIIQ